MDMCTNRDIFLINTVHYQRPDDISNVIHELLCNRQAFSQQAINSSLLLSCQNGPLVLVQSLMSTIPNLEVRDERGNTPLLVAVAHCQVNIVRLLLSKGANVNATNMAGDTALIISTYFSASHNVTQLLLDQPNISIEYKNINGFTALNCAVCNMNLEAAKLLIDANASFNMKAYESNLINHSQQMCQVTEQILRQKEIENVIKLFKLQSTVGLKAITRAALERDLKSAQLISIMDNVVLKYDCNDYIETLFDFLKTIWTSDINDNEIKIIKILISKYKFLSTSTSNHAKEKMVMELAVEIGHTSLIQLLCASEFSVSNKVISQVSSKGLNYLLRMLLSHNANINLTNPNGHPQYQESALSQAIHNEQFICAKILLQHNAYMDVNFALKQAVETSRYKCVEFVCIEFPKASIEAIQSSNLLHLAVKLGQHDVINLLLDNGANVNKVLNNKCPLIETYDIKIVDLLVKRGADVNLLIGSDFSFQLPLHYFVSKKHLLHLSATNSNSDWQKMHQIILIKQLIQHGANIDGLDSKERTALMKAAKRCSSDVLKALLDAGADKDHEDRFGRTALHQAVRGERMENVKLLLQFGANVNIRDHMDLTAIFHCESVGILKLFTEYKANFNVQTFDGNNPLMYQLSEWQFEISTELYKLLIEGGCDVNHQNRSGKTPLLMAAGRVEPDVVSLLLQYGADVNYAVTSDREPISVVTILRRKLWNRQEEAMECFKILADHSSLDVTLIPPSIIHTFISVGCSSLAAQYISLGLGPSCIEIQKAPIGWYKFKQRVSALGLCLLTDNLSLAQHLVDIRYLTKSDIALLLGDKEVLNYCKKENKKTCLEFLKTNLLKCMSLETLSLTVVSEHLGFGPDRAKKIRDIQLPLFLQEALLYRNVPTDLKDSSAKRNLLFFKSSLSETTIHPDDRDYGYIHVYESDFDSDMESD